MNAMDRIHHVEHRRPSRVSGRFEQAWGATSAPASSPDALATVPPPHRPPDDFAD